MNTLSNAMKPKFGRDRKPHAIKYLFVKWQNKKNLREHLLEALGAKKVLRVERRNGVEMFVTVDKRSEWKENNIRLMNYNGG